MIAVGTVKENTESGKEGWVKAEYALGEKGKCLSDWMPVMSGYGGDGFGRYEIPEIGSQVIIGFLHDDEEQPIVLGCLLGHKNKLPSGVPGEKSEKKVFRTMKGYQTEIDEEQMKVRFSDTEGKDVLVFKEKDGILVVDVKTSLELRIDGEVMVKVEKDKVSVRDKVVVTDDVAVNANKVSVDAKQDLKLSGQQTSLEGTTVKLDAKQLELKGTQWKAEGTNLEIKAGAVGKLESGGMLQVKGAMVKLN